MSHDNLKSHLLFEIHTNLILTLSHLEQYSVSVYVLFQETALILRCHNKIVWFSTANIKSAITLEYEVLQSNTPTSQIISLS
jgi:hypothetical protein